MEEELILFDEQKCNMNKIVYCNKKINEIFNNVKIIYKLLGYNYDIEINNLDFLGEIDDNLINIYYAFEYSDIYKFEVKFIFKNIYNKFILDYIRINNIRPCSLYYETTNSIINGLEELLKKI